MMRMAVGNPTLALPDLALLAGVTAGLPSSLMSSILAIARSCDRSHSYDAATPGILTPSDPQQSHLVESLALIGECRVESPCMAVGAGTPRPPSGKAPTVTGRTMVSFRLVMTGL